MRYGQYGQVGVDGVWRDKESEDEGLKHSSVLTGLDVKEYTRIMEYLEIPRSRREIQEFCGYKSRDSFMKNILNPLIDSKKVDLLIPDKPKSPKQKYVKNNGVLMTCMLTCMLHMQACDRFIGNYPKKSNGSNVAFAQS